MPVLLMMYLDGVVVAVGANGRGRAGNEDLLDAGDGRRGSSPLLPGGPASSGPGAVADGRRGAGSPYTSSARAQLRRGMWTSGSKMVFDLRTTFEKNRTREGFFTK
jgi:hypothetical protein